jgi:hemoglobin
MLSEMADDPTIYDWGGGREAFARWLNAFYDLVEDDELLSPVFDGLVTEQHREHVTDWWCEVMGGPPVYTERRGGYPRMMHKHLELHITPEQRRRFVSLLSEAADLAGLPDDPEFRAAIIGYRSGARGWRCTTPSPAPTWCRRRPSRAGAGASPRPTSPSPPEATTSPRCARSARRRRPRPR